MMWNLMKTTSNQSLKKIFRITLHKSSKDWQIQHWFRKQKWYITLLSTNLKMWFASLGPQGRRNWVGRVGNCPPSFWIPMYWVTQPPFSPYLVLAHPVLSCFRRPWSCLIIHLKKTACLVILLYVHIFKKWFSKTIHLQKMVRYLRLSWSSLYTAVLIFGSLELTWN